MGPLSWSSKGTLRVTSSHSTRANEYTSTFSLAGSSLTISGAIHWKVPHSVMIMVESSLFLLRLKSPIFTTCLPLSLCTNRLAERRSRWMTGGLRPWRYSIPLAACRAKCAVVWRSIIGMSSGLRRYSSTVPPLQKSVTMDQAGLNAYPMILTTCGLSRRLMSATSFLKISSSSSLVISLPSVPPVRLYCFTTTAFFFHLALWTTANRPSPSTAPSSSSFHDSSASPSCIMLLSDALSIMNDD
mmetsp:Transcript_13745/g.43476  ORF Transcript_13745/g.43476 Transcript_13745/m.43476 type:complete len:243 (+) Transcript_13745:279-1007(+)